METPAESCLAIGESNPMDILGNAFFDGDSDDDDSSSMTVKGRDDVESSGKLPMKPKGSFGDGPSKARYTVWRRLAEIFSVRFLTFEKLNLEDVYGVILAAGLYSYVIFERYFGDPPLIDSEGYIRLTGPRRAVVASDGLTLRSYLFNSRMMEHPCCHRGVMWTSMHTSFDQFMCEEIESDFGPIEVQYAVYRNSAEAILEVSLIDWEGNGEWAASEVQIFGTVTARNNMVTDYRARSLLFYKKSEEAIRIGCADSIPVPLSRNVTVLPLGSTLMVDFCICYRSNKLSVDEILVEETVPFDPSLTGEEEKIVCGNRGKIKVKATWKTHIDWQEIEGIL